MEQWRKEMYWILWKVFEALNGKYGADGKGEYTFINQAGKSVIHYALVYGGLISNLVEFSMGDESISSHMTALTASGNMLQTNLNVESIL